MHDSHVHGSCGECTSFVAVFPEGSRLDDWGFCREQSAPPSPPDLDALRDRALAGDRASLRQNPLGIYRTSPDDACDFFKHLE